MMRRLLPLALLALAGCAPSLPSTLTADQAQVAIQESANSQAAAMQVAAPTISDVVIGTCKRSDTHPLMSCPHTQFSLGGLHVDTRVVFWATPNPAHPYRATFSLNPTTASTP